MGIEVLTNKNLINIAGLVLEKPKQKPELLFDPKAEITKSDLENIEDHFNNLNNLPSLIYAENAFNIFISMRILAPERFGHLQINQKHKEEILRKYKKTKMDEFGITKTGEYAYDLKLGAPDAFSKIDLTNIDFSKSRNNYKTYLNNGLQGVFWRAFNLLVLFPQKHEEISSLSQAQWVRVKEMTQNNLNYGMVKDVAFCKVCYPEKFKEIKITPPVLKQFKDLIDYYRQKKNWDSFTEQAAFLKVIAAKKVEITDIGIEVVMPGQEKDLKKPESIPEEINY